MRWPVVLAGLMLSGCRPAPGFPADTAVVEVLFEHLPIGATAIAMITMAEPRARTESTSVGSAAVGVIMLVEAAETLSDER